MIEPTDEMVQLAVKKFLHAPGVTIREIDAAMREALAEVFAIFVQRVEGARDTGLCDCYDPRDPENEPTSPRTGEPMDHHCDCRAVETAAVLLGDGTKTQHAAACGCGRAEP